MTFQQNHELTVERLLFEVGRIEKLDDIRDFITALTYSRYQSQF